MASNKGKTGWKHDDHKVQREFERKDIQLKDIYNKIGLLEENIGSISEAKAVPDTFKPTRGDWLHGIVYVNTLPLDPVGAVYTESEFYKYRNNDYNPDNGYYGWYVYAVIRHNRRITPKDKFIAQFFDLQRIDDRGVPDFDESGMIEDNDVQIYRSLHHWDQWAYPYYEGLNRNEIIVHGVYKPDMHYFDGVYYPPDIYMLDENHVVTNLIYYYNIIFEEKD